jgi:hypothetical protein
MNRLTRGEAIRAKCLECCCNQSAEVRRCPCEKCPLFPYRMGHEDTGVNTDIPDELEDEKTALRSPFFTAELIQNHVHANHNK